MALLCFSTCASDGWTSPATAACAWPKRTSHGPPETCTATTNRQRHLLGSSSTLATRIPGFDEVGRKRGRGNGGREGWVGVPRCFKRLTGGHPPYQLAHPHSTTFPCKTEDASLAALKRERGPEETRDGPLLDWLPLGRACRYKSCPPALFLLLCLSLLHLPDHPAPLPRAVLHAHPHPALHLPPSPRAKTHHI